MIRSVAQALLPTVSKKAVSYFWIASAGVLGICILVYLLALGEIRLALTTTIVFVLVSLAAVDIRLSILAVVGYLIVLGDLRRVLVPITGWSGTDPMILIGPVFAIVLFAYALASRQVKFDTPLARWALVLMVIMAIQIFNPRQGGLKVGIAGVMFVMLPLFWFWIGRTFATKSVMETLLYWVVVPMSVLAALFGLYQSFYGYLPYQMMWFEVAGYSGLGNVNTGLSPISFFASGTEHGNFLIVGMLILFCVGITRRNDILLFVPLILVAVFLTGSRGPVVRVLGMCVGLWAVMAESPKTWIPRGALALLVVGCGLVWSLTTVTSAQIGPSNIQGALNRQASELAGQSPDDGHSSALVHLTLIAHGYIAGIQEPVGFGLGATSKAAHKFNPRGKPVYGTETDIGDSFLNLGLPGGLVYHYIVFLIITSGFRYWKRTRSTLALAILGVLGATFLMWLGGGQYAISPLVWLCVGALDRFENSPTQVS